jgi:hypothetical protein
MKEQIEKLARDICHLNVSCDECTMLAKQTGQSKERYCKAMQYAKRAYEKGWRKHGEWISVEDRMPDRPGEYLVYTWNGHILMCNCCDYLLDGDLQFDNYNVTHWMPLPEAPKEE